MPAGPNRRTERQSHRDGPPLLQSDVATQLGSLEETVLTLAEALLLPHAPQIPATREASRDASREGSKEGSREGSKEGSREGSRI